MADSAGPAPTFRAALSGAGARLSWHCGVLLGYRQLGWECLEYRGSSGGGLVAVAAACGRLDWLVEELGRLRTRDVYRSAGLLSLWKGHRYDPWPLRLRLEEADVREWRPTVPVRLALYDLQTQRGLAYTIEAGACLGDGDHLEALWGTWAIPGLFPPAHGGRWVDGGVTEAVPATGPSKVPWVVSVAMATALPPKPAPPRGIVGILARALNGLVAEVVRGDLAELGDGVRLHVLPEPERYPGLEFDPEVAGTLVAAGAAAVRP